MSNCLQCGKPFLDSEFGIFHDECFERWERQQRAAKEKREAAEQYGEEVDRQNPGSEK
jgi:hypothetical protein